MINYVNAVIFSMGAMIGAFVVIGIAFIIMYEDLKWLSPTRLKVSIYVFTMTLLLFGGFMAGNFFGNF